jgi:dipeptidyl aminopeptidase/acylaminoacyl peptidase
VKRRAPGAVPLFALLALACAGPGTIDLASLPPSPVAVLYRDEELALERIDALRDMRKRGTPSEHEGVIRLETLDAVFGGAPDVQRRLAEVEGDLALVDPASGEAKVLPGLPPGAKPLAWSPDRTRLLLSGRWRDTTQLFVWERANEQVEIATSAPGEHPMGCIGGDGRLVAVEAHRVGGTYTGRLVATPPAGGGLRPVTPGPTDVLPACSPSEPLVAYVTASEDGSTAIAVLALDDPAARPRVIARGVDPDFTPDGQWIVYAAPTAEGTRLFRIRPDGAGRTRLGAGPFEERQPSVSPDGAYVAYVVDDGTERERLRVRRFDGTGDRPLVTSGDASQPVW